MLLACGKDSILGIQGMYQNLSKKRMSMCLSIMARYSLVMIIVPLPPEVIKEDEL